MSNAIEKYQPSTLDDIQRVATIMVTSGYFPQAKGDAKVAIARIATAIMAGQEMGYTPFASVNGIHVVQGKPVISANLMAAAVKAHPRYNYRVRKLDNESVEIEFFEGGESLGVESFSMADAKAAGLTGKDNWKKYPRNMLFARCISNGVRFRCPDVFSGNAVYTPDEFDLAVDADGDVVEVEAQPLPDSLEEVEAQPDQDTDDNPALTRMIIELKNTFNGLGADGATQAAKEKAAREWYLGGWSTENTPDNARTSATQFSADECDVIADHIKSNRARLHRKYEAYLAKQKA